MCSTDFFAYIWEYVCATDFIALRIHMCATDFIAFTWNTSRSAASRIHLCATDFIESPIHMCATDFFAYILENVCATDAIALRIHMCAPGFIALRIHACATDFILLISCYRFQVSHWWRPLCFCVWVMSFHMGMSHGHRAHADEWTSHVIDTTCQNVISHPQNTPSH